MAADTRTAKVLLQWQTDNASIAQSVSANKSALSAIRVQADADYNRRVQQIVDIQTKNAAMFADIRKRADEAYEAQVKAASAPPPGLLSHLGDESAAIGFLHDLEQIQAAETGVGQAAEVAAVKVGALNQRLAEADKVRASAGDSTGGLRDLAFGGSGAGDAGGGTGGSSASSVLGNLRQSAIALPGVGFQSPLVIGLRVAEKAADATGASLAQLGVAGGITAAALIAIKLAFDTFNKTIEGGKNRLSAALTAQQNYYDALQSSTTAQVKATVATLEHNQAVLKQQIDETTDAIRSAQTVSASSLPQLFFDVIVRKSTELIGATGDLTKRQDDLKQQYQAQEDTITRLKQGLVSGAFAINDIREVEEKLQKAREDSASQLIALFDQEANDRVRLAELRRTGSVDQVNAELDANKDRETILRNFLIPAVASLGLTTDAATKRTQELNDELDNLTHNDELLVQAVLPVVAQREAEVALLKAQKDQSDALNDVLQDINKTQVDLAAASEKTAAALADQRQAETDHSNKLIDIQAQYAAAQLTALQKKNEQFAKIDQQSASRALEQRENLNLQIEGLVATGHIAEAQQAIRAQRLKETQDARQVQQQKDDATKSYNDQLKAADDQKAKLLDSEADRYAKERQQRQDAYNKAVQDQQALQNRLLSLRDQEQSVTRYWISATVTALYKVQDATGNFAANMQNYANLINATNSGRSGGSAAPSYGNGLIGPTYLGSSPGAYSQLPAVTGTAAMLLGNPVFNSLPHFAGGIKRVPFDMAAVIHKDERVLTAAENNNGAAVTVNVDARGSTIPQAQWEDWSERTAVRTIQAITERNNRVNRKS